MSGEKGKRRRSDTEDGRRTREGGREGGREARAYLKFAFLFSTLLLREPSAGKCAAATTSVL